MIRLGKLTDYGVVILVHIASAQKENAETNKLYTAAAIAEKLELSRETVAKCLKSMQKSGILESRRGVAGGYALARPAEKISIAEVVAALEGPIALTECVSGHNGACCIENTCPVRGGWDKINAAVYQALDNVSLQDMVAR